MTAVHNIRHRPITPSTSVEPVLTVMSTEGCHTWYDLQVLAVQCCNPVFQGMWFCDLFKKKKKKKRGQIMWWLNGMMLRTDSGGIKTSGSTGTEVWGRVQMKNIRSNCMTKPPWAWFGGGEDRGKEGGCQGMWGAGGREPGQSIVR